jgi:hypothetical protein
VREHQRVVVDVDDPGRGRDRLRHLVHVIRGRQAGPDVEELPNAGLGGQVPDRAAEERPVLARGDADGRVGLQDLLGGLAVGRKVVLAAEEVVVDPRHVRPGDVELRDRGGLLHRGESLSIEPRGRRPPASPQR